MFILMFILIFILYIAGAILLFFFLFALYTELVTRWDVHNTSRLGSTVACTCRTNTFLTETMTSYVTERDMSNSEKNECAICLSLMFIDSPEGVERLRCGHIFHRICLSDWMSVNYICPTCRAKGCCVRILDN